MGCPPLRVMIVALGYFRVPDAIGGGADLHTYHLANALARRGIEVHYVADTTAQAQLEPNVYLHRIGAPLFSLEYRTYAQFLTSYFMANVYSARRAAGVLRALRASGQGPDVVHVHGNLSGLILRRLLPDTPLVYTAHNPTPWMCRYDTATEHVAHLVAARLFEIPVWRASTTVVSLSGTMKIEMMRLGIDGRKIAVVPGGVDINLFRRLPRARDGLGGLSVRLASPDKWCLFVGQLVKRKGIGALLKAVADVGGLGCIIAGGGPERKALGKLAASLHLGNRAFFTGPLDQGALVTLYSASDMFVMPSNADALPLVMLEAMSCALPVVATNVAAAPEIVMDGFNGFLVPPRHIAALAGKLQALCNSNSLARHMGANAERFVRDHYTWDRVAEAAAMVYRGDRISDSWLGAAEAELRPMWSSPILAAQAPATRH